MSRSAAVALIAAALVLIALAVVVVSRSDRAGPPAPDGEPADGIPAVEPGEGVVARLYFAGAGGRLHPVERELPLEGSPVERARILVLALLEGPQAAGVEPGAGLSSALPPGMRLRHVFRPDPDTLMIDLEPPEDPAALAMGSRQELAAVYGLVDTLVFNLAEIERVGLLLGGVQRPTFAGHVDTSVALAPDRRLVAPGESSGG